MNVVFLGAIAIILGTVLGAPTVGPIVVGAAIGYFRPVRAVQYAAAAGALGWGALLVVAALRGGAIGSFSGKLGEVLGLPGIAMILVTMVYPAALAAAAAWLVTAIRSRNAAADSVRS
jgi:hypothetical protein